MPLKKIGFTTRVINNATYPERRDAFDQRWISFFEAVGVIAVPIPNQLTDLEVWFDALDLSGIVLTGGNDISEYGGDAPERDQLEIRLIELAKERNLPLIGVCRGLQLLYVHAGGGLEKIEGHVTKEMKIQLEGEAQTINSYHNWGVNGNVEDFEIIGRSEDGVIKAIKHTKQPIYGMMWHPERFDTFRKEDIQLFRKYFCE